MLGVRERSVKKETKSFKSLNGKGPKLVRMPVRGELDDTILPMVIACARFTP